MARTPAALQRNAELEAAIAEDPYDEERWIVLEDWLLEREDPRARIVLLEKRGKPAARAYARLHPQLFGAQHAALTPLVFAANWRAGYLRECHFAATDKAADHFADLCRAPACAIVRALTVSVSDKVIGAAMAALGAAAFTDSLHALTVSNVYTSPPRFDAATLAPLHRLRRLALRGTYVAAEATLDRAPAGPARPRGLTWFAARDE